MTGEFAAIDRLRRRLPAAPPGEAWIGDDTAVVVPPAGPLLLAAEAVVAGVHADLSVVGLDGLGWKAMVANLSDLAAMGGWALHALVTVAGPPETDLDLLYQGIDEAARTFGCPVVGGDLSNAPCLCVSVAVTGTCDGAPVLRSGARPGDALFVTGPLGAAAASRWSVRPLPRLAEGAAAKKAGATAMIDVSDGFLADLAHLADASGVGAQLGDVPVADGATREQALQGGEDYELVFAAPDADRVAAVFAEAGLRPPALVGRCTAAAGRRPPSRGWEHAWR